MINIPVKTSIPYEIILTKGGLSDIGCYVKTIQKPCNVFIITDDNVAPFYLHIVSRSLQQADFCVKSFIFKSGEQHKTIDTYFKAVTQLAKENFNREDIVVALGGGVVGDIAGFVASTYMRGINFIQVPTTLLSGIDASIGGKTGIDLVEGKNLVGTFHQPKAVFFDTETLKTLPKIEFLNGLGEGVKYAVLSGGELFEIMEKGIDESNLLRFIELCIIYKKNIVEQDEKESGLRRLLNLGHTIGHAIEKLSNFTVPHGIAVVKGINIIAKASYANNKLSKIELDKLTNLIEKYGFDISCPFDTDTLLSAIVTDKKMTLNNSIYIADILALGNCYTAKYTLNELKEYIYAALY